MAIVMAALCDHPGCERYKVSDSRSRVRDAATEAGWYAPHNESRQFCPDHYPLRRCSFCDRPMRPWGKRVGEPGMAGTVSMGWGGRCNTCASANYEAQLDRAVETYWAKNATMLEPTKEAS